LPTLDCASPRVSSSRNTDSLSNLQLHGLDFAQADAIWDGFAVTFEDVRESYGERRWVAVGWLGLDIVVLVYAERDDDIRYISLRKATPYETKIFAETAEGQFH
ncbi:MAG: BrnT family toxin, partial [Gammaproteobacteria bacterium]